MKVGIIQSNFLPWLGYFDFIRETDLFIIHDDLQYTKGDWRNRNKIKTPRGVEWITVPVHYRNTSQLIEETPMNAQSTPLPLDANAPMVEMRNVGLVSASGRGPENEDGPPPDFPAEEDLQLPIN